jgi:predicted SnoaL-like aldol condensation-catalyzing enzyme
MLFKEGWITRVEPVHLTPVEAFGQPVNWIAADILRITDRILVEHWDVI